ncbi:MAG TPA: hypothetical protein VHX20_12015 [Terracidiphilus sp.]|jgi:hypothetical protein|nr:hypothetical protein [Terracidiphilus sp.]
MAADINGGRRVRPAKIIEQLIKTSRLEEMSFHSRAYTPVTHLQNIRIKNWTMVLRARLTTRKYPRK